MIPLHLSLHNFLSYQECEVNFAGLHLATLAGRNGNGKSALLDAITWALWGEARGRIEDARIYHGRSEMRVALDFEVDGASYRVIRKRTRKRPGALDLFQIDAVGAMRAITGGTIRETQAELNHRLHMDYQTFINSVFLVQGRSNEFTTQSPSERKKVLRKVLGLERYEALTDLANQHRREAEAEATQEERRIEADLQELEEKAAIEQRLEAVVREREELATTLEKHEAEADQLRIAAAEHERREQAISDARNTLETREQELERRAKTVVTLEAERANVAETLARAPATRQEYEALRAARAEERTFAALAVQVREVESAIAAADSGIAKELSGLEARIRGLDEQRGQVDALVATLPSLREEGTALDGERTRLQQFDAAITSDRDAAAAARTQQATHLAEAEGYRARAQELKDHEETLASAQGEALCPVCRKALAPDDLRNTLDHFKRERSDLGTHYRRAKDAAAEAQAFADDHEKRLTEAQREREALDTTIQERDRALAARLARAQQAEQELPAFDRELAALHERIEQEAFAGEARAQRAEACSRLAALAYDREEHQRLSARLIELEPAEAAFNELTSAQAQAQGLDDRLTAEREERDRSEQALTAVQNALTEARNDIDATQDVSGRLDTVEAAVAECRDRITALDQDRGRIEERRATLDRLAARVEDARGRLAAARDAAQLYTDLARAFGPNGVQAMLIQQALPEIARIANDLLDQLTEGRSSTRVSLATQAETASGKVSETLSISISDDLGTRDYEMYSGGEKFRVDFALRIALSYVLAARSGASLPTLIIDEGFGTQDEEGRDRLVAAINTISSEFRLILLVTHIESLRESFGRRIEVTKDPERGSRAVVV